MYDAIKSTNQYQYRSMTWFVYDGNGAAKDARPRPRNPLPRPRSKFGPKPLPRNPGTYPPLPGPPREFGTPRPAFGGTCTPFTCTEAKSGVGTMSGTVARLFISDPPRPLAYAPRPPRLGFVIIWTGEDWLNDYQQTDNSIIRNCREPG